MYPGNFNISGEEQCNLGHCSVPLQILMVVREAFSLEGVLQILLMLLQHSMGLFEL